MSKAVVKQILRLEQQGVRAFNQGDVRGAVQIFDKGFVGFSSTQHERIRGLGALAKTFRHYLALSPKMSYRIEKPHVHVSGKTAVATFYWAVRLGGRRKIHGRGTHVFTRQGKKWRVVHEHFSRAH